MIPDLYILVVAAALIATVGLVGVTLCMAAKREPQKPDIGTLLDAIENVNQRRADVRAANERLSEEERE